jgi:hypothetical protein
MKSSIKNYALPAMQSITPFLGGINCDDDQQGKNGNNQKSINHTLSFLFTIRIPQAD